MKKMTVCSLTLAMVAALLTGCGSQPAATTTVAETRTEAAGETAAETTEAKTGEKIVIGVAMKTLSDQFPLKTANAIKDTAAGYDDVEIVTTDAKADVSTQLADVENLIAQGCKVIILNAQDAEGLGAAVDACGEAGIPVVEVNTRTSNENYSSYVGSSDVVAGKMQGEFVADAIGGEGEVAIMYGVMGQSGQIERLAGVKESLLDAYPNVKLVADQTANWQTDEAMKLAEGWILAYPDLKAILCQNDDMAMGALQAVQDAGVADKTIVVGVDATDDALNAVKEGKMACTVFQDAEGQGKGAFDAAYKLAKGETVEKEYMIDFQLVTKENVDQYLK